MVAPQLAKEIKHLKVMETKLTKLIFQKATPVRPINRIIAMTF